MIICYLERHGWLARDAENSYLALDAVDDDPLRVLQGQKQHRSNAAQR